MRNRTTTIMLLISIALLIFLIFVGINIGKIKVLSISNLNSKNEELNEKINEATKITTIDYPNRIDTLKETYERYQIEKSKYEEIAGFNTDEYGKRINETKKYDITYLWKTFGKYATSYNLTISMDLQQTNSQNNLYDLNFSISGQYVNISEFIAKLENNSDFNFRIYNFKMSGTGETISAGFTVKDVCIDPSTITNSITPTKATETIQVNPS